MGNTSAIKPIETVYKGYRFRSRLEARWAVFFDAMGIKYEYEPEGFDCNGYKYLPDFYLNESDIYIEIKSVGALNLKIVDDGVVFENGTEKAEKYEYATVAIANEHTYMILQGDPLDVLICNHGGKGSANIFFKGICKYKIMSKNNSDMRCEEGEKCIDCDHYTMGCHYGGIIGFTPKGAVITADTEDTLTFIPENDKTMEMIILRQGESPLYTYGENEIREVLRKNLKSAEKARQARFERGEKPVI